MKDLKKGVNQGERGGSRRKGMDEGLIVYIKSRLLVLFIGNLFVLLGAM